MNKDGIFFLHEQTALLYSICSVCRFGYLVFIRGNSSSVCITSPTGVQLVFFGFMLVGEDEIILK